MICVNVFFCEFSGSVRCSGLKNTRRFLGQGKKTNADAFYDTIIKNFKMKNYDPELQGQ